MAVDAAGSRCLPDVAVASSALVDQNPARLHAQDVLLVIEVISPGSSETDRIVKLHEHAKAGIPAYWVLDLGDRLTLWNTG
jgi:Uma2 family endonuclease